MKLHFVFALAILIKYAGAECITTFNGIGPCDECSYSCDSYNGCLCVNTNTSDNCLPSKNSSCSLASHYCCQPGLYYSTNESCCTETPVCLPQCANDEICNLDTCVCDASNYPNFTIGAFHPTIVCENNVITVVVSVCELDILGYDPYSMQLRETGENCSYPISNISNDQRTVSFQTQAVSKWCGNTVESDVSNIYISNTINITGKDKTIITKNPIRFNYSCGYKRNMQTSLQLPGNITTQTVDLAGINGTGLYPVTMSAYKDLACTIPFTNEDQVVVGSDIFVGIFVTGVDAGLFVLRIEKCIASPTDKRDGSNAFSLIENGCAKDTVSTEVKQNGNASEARFRISSFQFQDQPSVYIFCDVRLCEKNKEICSDCKPNGKSSNLATNEVQIGLNIDQKLDFADNAGINTVASWALLLGIQVAFLFIKFF